MLVFKYLSTMNTRLRQFVVLLILISGTLFLTHNFPSKNVSDQTQVQLPQLKSSIDRSQISSTPSFSNAMMGFIQNQGQINNPDILYYFSSNQYTLGFGASQIYMVSQIPATDNVNQFSFSILYKDSNLVNPEGIKQITSNLNFFYGSDSFQNVPSYNEIVYHNIYSNIDLRYYLTEQGLKYDFIVKPGGDPSSIIINPQGVDFTSSAGKTTFYDPKYGNQLFTDDQLYVYTSDSSQVDASFQQLDHGYQFNIGHYDHSLNLIIDPMWLYYSSYLGGLGGTEDGRAITVDSQGQAIITGYTTDPTTFPLTSGFGVTANDDIFLVKLNSTGSGIIFASYIGSNSGDRANGITVDLQDNIYLTGYTGPNTGFPIKNAFNSTQSGSNDAFVLKLNSTGNGLIFSTFLGGAGSETGYGIKVDNLGNSYVIGTTTSDATSFPLKNAYNSTYGGSQDIFMAKLNSTGNGLIYSTYLGGSGSDYAGGIAIDGNGNAYIDGQTYSTNFPLMKAIDSVIGGVEGFVLGLNSTGNGLLFSTYFGGTNDDGAYGINLDTSGNIYIAGNTYSTNLPTSANAYDKTLNAGPDAFVAKLNNTGTGLVYGTYIGGAGGDNAYAIGVDNSGNAVITGNTQSDQTTFPISNAFDSTYNGGLTGDVFVTKLNSTGSGLIYSTYLGGSTYNGADGSDVGRSLALDSMGNVYVTGQSKSPDFPLKLAVDNSNYYAGATGVDAFVFKVSGIVDDTAPIISITSPLNNTAYYFPDLALFYSVSDISPYSVTVSLDNTPLGSAHTGYILSGLTNGLHNVTIQVTDSVNLITTIAHNFTIDLNGPSVNILNPVSGFLNTATPSLSYRITNQSTLAIDWYINNVLTQNLDNGSSLPLAEGWNNITVVVTDQQARTTSQQRIVTVDTTTPVINYSNPVLGYYSSQSILLQYSVTEINLSHTNIYIDSQLNSTNIPSGSVLTLGEGAHNITIEVVDLAGNSAVHEQYFTVDTISPQITITSPGTTVQNTSIILEYQISDASPISSIVIYVDNVANVTGLESGVGLDLGTSGTHNITIVVTDLVGNIGSATLMVTVNPPTTNVSTSNTKTSTTLPPTTSSTPPLSTSMTSLNSSSTPTSKSSNSPFAFAMLFLALTVILAIYIRRNKNLIWK